MRLRHFIAFGLITFLAACGGDSSSPTAQPTPAPTPVPTATPTPTPTPQALGCTVAAADDCTAPEGPSGVFGCCRRATQNNDRYGTEVVAAIEIVQREHPEFFQGEEGRVSDVRGLGEAICQTMEEHFLICCSPGQPEDEIGVKKDNSYSEQFDFVFGTGFVRPNGYAAFCQPSRF